MLIFVKICLRLFQHHCLICLPRITLPSLLFIALCAVMHVLLVNLLVYYSRVYYFLTNQCMKAVQICASVLMCASAVRTWMYKSLWVCYRYKTKCVFAFSSSTLFTEAQKTVPHVLIIIMQENSFMQTSLNLE